MRRKPRFFGRKPNAPSRHVSRLPARPEADTYQIVTAKRPGNTRSGSGGDGTLQIQTLTVGFWAERMTRINRFRSFGLKAALTIIVVAVSGLAYAHHSFASEFDENKPVTLEGKVTRVEWMSPHAYFSIEVDTARGKTTNWDLELGSPNALQRAGWTRNTLKPGDRVKVRGYQARDRSTLANAIDVRLPDGRRVFAGSSAGTNTRNVQ
jgi:hypothetical protein